MALEATSREAGRVWVRPACRQQGSIISLDACRGAGREPFPQVAPALAVQSVHGGCAIMIQPVGEISLAEYEALCPQRSADPSVARRGDDGLHGPDLVRDPTPAFFDMFFRWRVALPSSDLVAADGVKQEPGDKKKRRARTGDVRMGQGSSPRAAAGG